MTTIAKPCPRRLALERELQDVYTGTFCEWAAKNVKLVGSALSEMGEFDPSETPWAIDVLNDCDPARGVLYNTFVKPVQCGGSVIGELAILCWLYFLRRGDIQYNWESDEKARERWKKRVVKIIEACSEVFNLIPDDNTKFQTCLIILSKLNFTMQGVESRENLASDSIRAQVNEEIHNWAAGKLSLAYGRTTAYSGGWFHHLNISNASAKGDQLHKAMENGTNQEWTVKCPGCGLYHAMRTRWEDHEPHLGGLRYDSTDCKREDGSYDYNRLAGTILNQMPCGYQLHRLADRKMDVRIRKSLSQTGRYSEPRNTGAHCANKSRTLEAVSVHYIDPLTLIMEKHDALKAWRYGDREPWDKYLRERECCFVDPEDIPVVQTIRTRDDVKKNREGLAGRSHRFFALDRQKGTRAKGEFPHWWLLIVDVGMIQGKLKVQLVFEGKIETDEDVIATLRDHDIKEHERRHLGVADSTWDTQKVQSFCFQHGINAICARGQNYFNHPKGGKQVFSVEEPLYKIIGTNPKYPYRKDLKGNVLLDRREPLFWFYSEPGTKDLLHHLRTADGIEIVIPSDVSEDFRKHMESWTQDAKKQSDGSIMMEYRQIRNRDDLYICFGYIAMLMRMAGLTGVTASTTIQSKPLEETTK